MLGKKKAKYLFENKTIGSVSYMNFDNSNKVRGIQLFPIGKNIKKYLPNKTEEESID